MEVHIQLQQRSTNLCISACGPWWNSILRTRVVIMEGWFHTSWRAGWASHQSPCASQKCKVLIGLMAISRRQLWPTWALLLASLCPKSGSPVDSSRLINFFRSCRGRQVSSQRSGHPAVLSQSLKLEPSKMDSPKWDKLSVCVIRYINSAASMWVKVYRFPLPKVG